MVAKDLTGVSARAMLAALLEDRLDAAAMAQLARGKLRAKIPQLEQALVGLMGPHQRAMIAWQLGHIDDLDALVAAVSADITARVRPFALQAAQVDTVTGIGPVTAETIIAEVGVDMTRFPDADHLTAWAGLAPGSNESAGKRRRAKTRKGSPALRAILVEAAQAAGRSKDTYLGALYHRLAARIGKKRAAVAVARKILVIVYHILTRHEPYRELGAAHLQQRDRQALERRLVRRLEALGNHVELHPQEPAA